VSHESTPSRDSIEWQKYPLSVTGNPFYAGSAFGERPIPKHRPDAEQIALMEGLGLNPRSPNWNKLRGMLLAKGLRPDDVRKLCVDEILAVLEYSSAMKGAETVRVDPLGAPPAPTGLRVNGPTESEPTWMNIGDGKFEELADGSSIPTPFGTTKKLPRRPTLDLQQADLTALVGAASNLLLELDKFIELPGVPNWAPVVFAALGLEKEIMKLTPDLAQEAHADAVLPLYGPCCAEKALPFRELWALMREARPNPAGCGESAGGAWIPGPHNLQDARRVSQRLRPIVNRLATVTPKPEASHTWGPRQSNPGDAKDRREPQRVEVITRQTNCSNDLQPRYPSPDTYERDTWILEQRRANKTWSEIIGELARLAPQKDWAPLESENGCRDAVRRIANYLGAEIPKVKAGRPRKTLQTPQ
jgi:hypothetical protein